jgi:Flp pilus assembly protein TadD/GGDEF domain-containing protein
MLAKAGSGPAAGHFRSSVTQRENGCAAGDFTEQALAHIDSFPLFSVLAVEIDTAEAPNVSTFSPETAKSVTQCLDRSCRQQDGVWGPLTEGCWAMFVPGKTAAEVRSQAEQIRACAAGENCTVTIGIAVYPTLDYSKRDILANACKALEHAHFFGPNSQTVFDEVSLNISGDKYYDIGDLNRAEAEFRQALRLNPEDANLHNSLGVCHADRGDFDQALASFETALRLKKNELLAAYNIAMVHRMKGHTDMALEFLKKAECGREARFEAKLQIGRIYLEDKAPEQARPYLEDASVLRPENGQVHCLLGECLQALEMEAAARSAYKKALRLNANDATALSGLGWIYHKLEENFEIATLFCRQSVEIAPENGLFRYRLARRYLSENRLKEARHHFEKAANLGYDTGNYAQVVRSRLMEKAS